MIWRDIAIGGANGQVIAMPFAAAAGVTMSNWWFVGLCAIGFFVGAYILWDDAGGGTA